MTKEKWKIVLGNVLDSFDVLEHDNEFLDEDGGINLEYVIFLSPVGKVKLEFVEKPMVLDKKTNYSRRIGSDTAVEYVYSETEKNSFLIAYRWSDQDDDWVEMSSDNFQ